MPRMFAAPEETPEGKPEILSGAGISKDAENVGVWLFPYLAFP